MGLRVERVEGALGHWGIGALGEVWVGAFAGGFFFFGIGVLDGCS